MEKLVQIIAKLSGLILETEELAKETFHFNDLTPTQMHYLEAISQLGNPNMTELSAEMKLTKPTVKVGIDKLIEKQYIIKVKSDEDRRSAHLHLTEKGKQINLMHDFAHQKIAETLSAHSEPTEIALLSALLDKILKKC